MNSKGSVAAVVLGIIIVIVFMALVIILLAHFGVIDISDFQTTVCTISNRVKGVFPKAYSYTSQTYGFLRFCKPQRAIIDPQDWDECNKEFKEASGVNMPDAARNCAMQQIWDMALKCWGMGGKGSWNPGSFRCYTGVVELRSAGTTTNDITEEKQLRDLYKEDIRFELGCLPDQDTCILNVATYGCRCDTVVSELADHHAKLATYNALSAYFYALVSNNPEKTGFGSEGYLVYCSEPGTDTETPGASLMELANPTSEQVSGIASRLLTSDDPLCVDAVDQIYDALIKGRSYAIKAEEARDAVNAKLRSCVKEGEVVEADEDSESSEAVGGAAEKVAESSAADYTSKIDRINTLMDTTKAITSSVPIMKAITQQDLQEFGKTIKVAGTDRTYAFELGGAHRLDMYGDYKIAPSSMFEVNFCNGVPLGAGIIAAKNGCDFSTTTVQVGAAGSGVAGLGRAGSPFCHMTSVLDGIVPGAKYVQFCKGYYWKVGGPLGA